ncbi:hypothetical protein [Microvirga sp. M2]|uniref:hypothetical protein n=1 Tax=Microvirga sp. M2 TaxID=3073270 RepID=UPI0039C20060
MAEHISLSSPAEAAQRDYAQHLILIAEFADLAARATAVGDTFGASRYARHAHEHMRESWRVLVRWRDQLEQQNGGRS